MSISGEKPKAALADGLVVGESSTQFRPEVGCAVFCSLAVFFSGISIVVSSTRGSRGNHGDGDL